MKKGFNNRFIPSFCFLLFSLVIFSNKTLTQSQLPCDACHSIEKADWLLGRHSNTQNDVAGELAANWKGQAPDSVINGSQAEDCLACHSPISVTTNGGMTEVQTISNYFTTTGGVFTDSTHAADTSRWPHLWCTTCHKVPSNHSIGIPILAIFNPVTKQYDSIQTSSMLCGQCHGTIRYADTDHRIYDAWKMSKHGHRGQGDIASELAASWAGKTPNDVINGPDAENCIACHAPTAVKQKHGDTTEVMALNSFFTTTADTFSSSTTVTDTSHWPDVGCPTCHNPHHPDTLSYYNSTTRAYQVMSSSNQLCGQCHGNLRFPKTDHLSYNIEAGTGGIGVSDQITMPGTQCTSCHMHKGDVDGTNSLMYKGHNWSIFVHEPDGSTSAACTSCHAGMNADSAKARIEQWKTEFVTLDSVANLKIAVADSFMQGKNDSLKQKYLDEAHQNLSFTESDESHGFHNHKYSIALLNDAIAKATLIITGIKDVGTNLPLRFELNQNYPNPFNPATTLKYALPAESKVRLTIYNVLGQVVATLVNEILPAGYKEVKWNAGSAASGVYFYRVEATSVPDPSRTFNQVKKMIYIK